jgi:hypothetical protein
MKKLILISALILFLYSCSNAPFFENDELGNLIDAANDRLYLYCGSYLRAAEIIAGPYARYDDYGTRRTLHEIPGADPEKWLSDNIKIMGLPLLFRESSVEEPALETFGAQRIHITEVGEINMRVGLIEGEQVRLIIEDFVHGQPVNRPLNIEHDYLFYFESPDYPGIYYVLNHFTGSDGQAYLFDRWTKRCVLLTPLD